MDREQKIKKLRCYKNLCIECENLHRELVEIRSSPLGPSCHDGAKSSLVLNQTGQIVDLVSQLEDQLETSLTKKLNLRSEIERAVETLEDTKLRNMMHMRYIQGLKWENVARNMNYSDMQVMRLHRDAIEKINL